MQYYLCLSSSGGTETVPLGSVSFGYFYPEHGFEILLNNLSHYESFHIVNDQGENIEYGPFLDMFFGDKPLKIRQQT